MSKKKYTSTEDVQEQIEQIEKSIKIDEEPAIIVEEEIIEEPKIEETKVEEKPIVEEKYDDIRYRDVVYLGISREAERTGFVTGNKYVFRKDSYGMPQSTKVDERDYNGLIAEKGKGCARRDASIMFMSKLEWDLELEQARLANSA
jgi:hypothetical protein